MHKIRREPTHSMVGLREIDGKRQSQIFFNHIASTFDSLWILYAHCEFGAAKWVSLLKWKDSLVYNKQERCKQKWNVNHGAEREFASSNWVMRCVLSFALRTGTSKPFNFCFHVCGKHHIESNLVRNIWPNISTAHEQFHPFVKS